jgi:lysine-N-methylase
MSLPIHTLPIVERWDCHQCGVCCRGSIVPLSDADLARLGEQKWHERPELAGRKTTVPLGDSRGRRQLAKNSDGSCVFLQPDGLCLIHKELGFDAKPLVCRTFPLQLVPREKDAVLTLRRACPSAAGDQGRELTEYLTSARSIASEGHLTETGVAAPTFKAGEASDWKRSRIILESLRRITIDDRYPPIRRLVHGLELCRLIEKARTLSLANGKLSELIQVLEQNIADETASHFSERAQPTGAVRVLFRQVALEVIRLHPSIYHRPSWSSRLALAGWAVKTAFGRGRVPKVWREFPTPTFAQLEEPIGRLEPLLLTPLGRYFETTTASYQYALADRSGWSVINSYRQLALLYPIALYLLRWTTSGRSATVDDMLKVIAAIDRSQGFAPLSGAKQRTRIETLVRLEQLSTIVVWYGR